MPLHPIERLTRRHDVPMPWKKWERLPRIQGYKKEYWDGEAHYTPRLQSCDSYLNLAEWKPPERPPASYRPRKSVSLQPLRDEHWPLLPPLFRGAFADQPPICEWGKHAAARAARCILEWARLGRDGPLVRAACVTAWSGPEDGADQAPALCGCAIITLANGHILRDAPPDATIPHPEDPSKPVIPHLNWIFVNRWLWRHGIGTMLLEEVVSALRRAGFRWLASTCLLSNGASMMWHWRNGFRLGSDDYGRRVRRKVGES